MHFMFLYTYQVLFIFAHTVYHVGINFESEILKYQIYKHFFPYRHSFYYLKLLLKLYVPSFLNKIYLRLPPKILFHILTCHQIQREIEVEEVDYYPAVSTFSPCDSLQSLHR